MTLIDCLELRDCNVMSSEIQLEAIEVNRFFPIALVASPITVF